MNTFKVRSEMMRSPRYIVICLALIIFVAQFGASLSDVPSVRLLEDIICHRYYHDSSTTLIPEKICLQPDVEAELNMVTMGMQVLSYVPSVLVAIPYGCLMDRAGRRLVLALTIVGMAASQAWWMVAAYNTPHWDIRYTWTSCVLLFMGGGQTVAEATVFAIISDVSPGTMRATNFQVVICSLLIGELLAPFAASAMMGYSLWLPLWVSSVIMMFGCGLVVLLLPETLHMRTNYTSEGIAQRTATVVAYGARSSSRGKALLKSLSNTMRPFRKLNVLFLTPAATLTTPLTTTSLALTLRYIPLRFGWSLAQTGMVLGVRTGLSIMVLLVFLPLLNIYLSHRNEQARDLLLARVSSALLMLGQEGFALGSSIPLMVLGQVVFTFGSGVPSLSRAVLAGMVDRDRVGRLFGVMALIETLGFIAASVGLGVLFQVSLNLASGSGDTPLDDKLYGHTNAQYLSLPFHCATVIFFMTFALLCLVRLGPSRSVDPESLEGVDPGHDGSVLDSTLRNSSGDVQTIAMDWPISSPKETRAQPGGEEAARGCFSNLQHSCCCADKELHLRKRENPSLELV